MSAAGKNLPGAPAVISVILPVLNEAETINAVIAHLQDFRCNAPFEIIVVDGDPGESTVRAIRGEGVITAVSAKGRARQMNRGAALAAGDVLLFLHADTRLPNGALTKIADVMKDERCVAGAFELGIDSRRRIFRVTEWYAALRTTITGIPFGDQAIFIRRRYFEKIGGYSDIPLMEDVELMKRIKMRGARICIIRDKVMTSARRWDREGILYCTVRNWALQLSYTIGVAPERLAKWYKQYSDTENRQNPT